MRNVRNEGMRMETYRKSRDLMFLIICAVVAVFAVFSSQVSAATVFTSRSAWESAVGSFATENFNGLTPYGFTTGLNSVGLIDVDITGSVNANQLGGPLTLDGMFAIDGTNHLIGHFFHGAHPTIIFPIPILGFAADWRTTTSLSNLVMMSFDGGTIHFDDYLSGDGTGFLGIIADNLFTQAVFGTEDGGAEAFGMDNLNFSPVPEPSTIILFALGGLALLRKRRT